MFNSVSRRYTPPTCTLEIAAKGSPLSQWTERPVVRRLQFQLSFDDPKLPLDQQIKIQGDRSQLEALIEAVSSYVQAFLMQSSTDLKPIDLESGTQNGRDSSLATASRGSRVELVQPESLFPGFEEDKDQFPKLAVKDAVSDSIHPTANAGIALQPRGLLAHNLLLGTLATAESGSVVCLSVVQLFDLANALDEYASEVLSLPALSRPWFRSRQGMLSIAAAALLAFGVTASLLKFLVEMNAPVQMAASTAAPEVGLSDQQVAIAPNPPQISGTKSPPPIDFASPRPLTLPLPPNATAFPGNSRPPMAGNQLPPHSNLPPREPLPPITIAPQPRAAQTQIPTQSVLPINPSASARVNNQSSADSQGADLQGSAEAPRTGLDASGADHATSSSTAFDTIPQIAEARDYFQQRWQPPSDLTQTLEYRLKLSADGTIQQIVPLGQAAGTYVDRTPIPLTGQPFVSPLQSGSTAEIRLVLSPNGRVRTFLENPN